VKRDREGDYDERGGGEREGKGKKKGGKGSTARESSERVVQGHHREEGKGEKTRT
jgi:hypothetical protein